MIVVDASALVEFLTDEGGHSARVARELNAGGEWVCPEHTLLEVTHALCGLWLGGRSTRDEFDARVGFLASLTFTFLPTAPMLPRIAALAANATAYDAAYLAVAEHTRAPLLTADRKLAGIPGAAAEVVIVA